MRDERGLTPRKLYNFLIDPELAVGLKRLKARDGAPESESVRRALHEYLEKKGVMKSGGKRAGARNRP